MQHYLQPSLVYLIMSHEGNTFE